MISKYFVPQDRPTLHAEFTDCIMKSNKLVGKSYDRLDALAYASNGSEEGTWTVFLRGLIPVVKDKLRLPEPTWTIQELVSRAIAAHQYIRQTATAAHHRARANDNLTTMVTSEQAFKMPLDQLLSMVRRNQLAKPRSSF
jgi:hypothetical protein